MFSEKRPTFVDFFVILISANTIIFILLPDLIVSSRDINIMSGVIIGKNIEYEYVPSIKSVYLNYYVTVDGTSSDGMRKTNTFCVTRPSFMKYNMLDEVQFTDDQLFPCGPSLSLSGGIPADIALRKIRMDEYRGLDKN